MIIYTVVEIDYPNGLSSSYEVNEWTFISKDKAEKFAKEKQNKYSMAVIASGYRYNTVNVFHSILPDF
jgi:hypothetical protein